MNLWEKSADYYAGFDMNLYEMFVWDEDNKNLMFTIPGINGLPAIHTYLDFVYASMNDQELPSGEFRTGYASMVLISDK